MKTSEGIEALKEKLEGMNISSLTAEDLENISGGYMWDPTPEEVNQMMLLKPEILAEPLSDHQREWVIYAGWQRMACLIFAKGCQKTWIDALHFLDVW